MIGLGYPSGEDGAILPARDYPLCPERKKFSKAKLVQSRWLDIGLVLFYACFGPRQKKEYTAIFTEQVWSITHTLGSFNVKLFAGAATGTCGC